ncbi:MAG: CRISPR-associated endonuclease Cas2 [Kiritimatiellae bacterium]|nr:CRISPR-associated endonuclease Cas2 [Kiritimatiellia bacterium]
MMVLVTYDVATTTPEGRKRLRRVAKTCLNFGQRVQNSVFECLVEPAQWVDLRTQLLNIYAEDEDSLRFYQLGAGWQKKVEHHGIKGVPDLQTDILVI